MVFVFDIRASAAPVPYKSRGFGGACKLGDAIFSFVWRIFLEFLRTCLCNIYILASELGSRILMGWGLAITPDVGALNIYLFGAILASPFWIRGGSCDCICERVIYPMDFGS
jgi:hypothetical protein